MNNRERQRRYSARQKHKERKTPTAKTQAEIAQYTCAIAALCGGGCCVGVCHAAFW